MRNTCAKSSSQRHPRAVTAHGAVVPHQLFWCPPTSKDGISGCCCGHPPPTLLLNVSVAGKMVAFFSIPKASYNLLLIISKLFLNSNSYKYFIWPACLLDRHQTASAGSPCYLGISCSHVWQDLSTCLLSQRSQRSRVMMLLSRGNAEGRKAQSARGNVSTTL